MKRPPNRVEASALAEAHEKAAEALRLYAKGHSSEKQLAKAYSKLTAAVQRELTATADWRHAVQHGDEP